MIDAKQFLLDLPNKVSPEAIDGLSSLFHFDISGAGQFTVSLDNGKMSVKEELVGEPKCKVSASAETLSKVLSGDTNPMMAMMTGKLKISNPGEMMKYAKIFGLM